MFQILTDYCGSLTANFNVIAPDRKQLLHKLSEYIQAKLQNNEPINLVFICTHNSRRSHFGQIWAKVAANYYQIPKVNTFSGGTEATAFNINAINALKRTGFKINNNHSGKNPVYTMVYDEQKPAIECFSKVYNDAVNPEKEFAAIMTCSDAEENCPFIPETDLRISITYDDPKAFDNTLEQDAKYDERCKQIATELFYVFSTLRK